MNCYKCGSTIDERRDICSKCGTDIRYFKKIVYASNRYYNEGLLKAQAQDLSGARDALRKSLQLYKKNTPARNLLGLTYYAMGESAEGLKEWVISKNLDEKSNVADRYINYLKRNAKELDSDNHGIKRYNQALNYARTGAEDLAVIQLKKVISVHPNMVKAYELLALLYIQNEKYDSAKKMLTKCLQVDRGNATALHYLRELEEAGPGAGTKSAGVVGDDDREQLIIPVRFRDFGSYLANAVYVLLGVAVGVAIAWFVIVPGKVDKAVSGQEAVGHSYEEQISSLEQQVAGLEKQSEEASKAAQESLDAGTTEETTEESTEESAESTEESTVVQLSEDFHQYPELYTYWSDANDALVRAARAYSAEDDAFTAVSEFVKVDPGMVAKTAYSTYRDLAVISCDEGIYERLRAEADAAAQAGNAELTEQYRDLLAVLHQDQSEPLMQAGMQYEADGNPEEAMNRYWQLVNLFPGAPEREDARNRYLALSGESEVPGLPDGVDLTKRMTPRTQEYYISEAGIDLTALAASESEAQARLESQEALRASLEAESSQAAEESAPAEDSVPAE